MSKLAKQQRSVSLGHAGYTIDQTILIVAIIAILITIIIATVGWDLISRTGGAKLAAQFRQIEDANGQFFAEHMRWPHQATGRVQTSVENMQVLIAEENMIADADFVDTICGGAACDDIVKNLLPGLRWDGTNVLHSFGSGSADETVEMTMRQAPSTAGIGRNKYLLVRFNHVSRAEVEEADENVDGELDAVRGRVFYRADGNPCAASGGAALDDNAQFANVCYAANLVQ